MKNRNAKIAIINYNLGNTQSISNAITYLGYKIIITDKLDVMLSSDIIVLPGVGAFEAAMKSIRAKNLIDILSEVILIRKKPILGICLGMQLLASSSEENGYCEGLNFVSGNVKKIIPRQRVRVPHVGWNNIEHNRDSILYQRLEDQNSFYFDHSFYFDCKEQYISAYCDYNESKLTASIEKDHIFGVQFHPEKSQNNGLRMFRSFIEKI